MAANSSGWFGGLFGASRPPQRSSAPSNPYHSVSILPGAPACGAVCRLAGQRFLSRQAPRLPLPTCDVKSCGCRFQHYKDRRAGPRRHSGVGIMALPETGKERRQSRGRRAEDQF